MDNLTIHYWNYYGAIAVTMSSLHLFTIETTRYYYDELFTPIHYWNYTVTITMSSLHVFTIETITISFYIYLLLKKIRVSSYLLD